MSRLERVRQAVDEILHELGNLEDKRCGFVHLYGVSLTATQLAKRRRMNPELASIAGMLHDIVSYESGDPTDHATRGAARAAEFLRELGGFTDDEIDAIRSAIATHSDKASRGSAFQELLKDADVIQHHLYNPAYPPHPRHAERLEALARQDEESAETTRPETQITYVAEDDLADKARDELRQWMVSVWGPSGSGRFLWAGCQWHVTLSIGAEAVSHVGLVRREIRVADRPLTVGGVSAVTTKPVWRQNGYSTQTLRHASRVLRDDLGVAFALLECEPEKVSFYARLGWKSLPEPAICDLPSGKGPVPGHVTLMLELADQPWPDGSVDLIGPPW